jgi:hypothetical protein
MNCSTLYGSTAVDHIELNWVYRSGGVTTPTGKIVVRCSNILYFFENQEGGATIKLVDGADISVSDQYGDLKRRMMGQ